MTKFTIYFLIFVSLVGSYSCRLKRIADNAPKLVLPIKDSVVVDKAVLAGKKVAQILLENDLKYEFLDIKGNIMVASEGKNLSSGIAIRIEKGKKIWLSLSPILGIEAFRALITPDSIFILDRLNKKAYLKSSAYINQMVGAEVDFGLLESCLVGSFEPLSGFAYESLGDSSLQTLKYQSQAAIYMLNARMFEDKLKLTNIVVRLIDKEQGLSVKFVDYKQKSDVLHLSELIFDVRSRQNQIINLNYNKFSVEKVLSFPFFIPEKYERMP